MVEPLTDHEMMRFDKENTTVRGQRAWDANEHGPLCAAECCKLCFKMVLRIRAARLFTYAEYEVRLPVLPPQR